MKKRVISIFLCLCMLAGLLPSGVLAADDSTLEMIYATSIPADYSGMVLSLEKTTATNGTQLYAVSIGMYNTPASGAYSVNMEFDKTVLRLSNATGGSALNWSSATVDGKYIPEMLEDPSNDEYGLLEASLTNTQGTGMFTQSIPAGSENQKNISYSLNVNTVGDLSALIKNLTTDPARYIPPQNTLVNLGTVYFKLQNGKTDADVTSSSIKLFPDPTDDRLASGAASIAGANTTTTGALMLNFPAPPEEAATATISVNNAVAAAKEGVTLSITGQSEQGVDIKDQQDAQTSVVTGADGTATVQLFPGSYTVSAADKTVDGVTYSSNGVTAPLTVTKNGTNTATITMSKVETSYPVNIRLVDKSGAPITDTTGASLSFTGAASPTFTGNSASFTVSSCNGIKSIALSGVPGYQNIVSGAVNIAMTHLTNTSASFSVTKGDNIAKIKTDGTTTYIELTLEPTVTMVKIPIPVPEGTTKEDAENLTATFTQGTEKITVDATVTENGDGTFSVTVDAPLPDGTYTMTIGGAGFDPVTKPVTVITGPDGKTIVNVGGTVTEADGTKTVTGGVTGVVDSTPNADGNNVVDLTGDDTSVELKRDSTVTVGSGESGTTEVTGGSNVTGGLLGDATLKDELTPAVMSDPVYEVETQLTKLGSGAYDTLEAKVYLKNAQAASGTFGMWYDKDLFELPATGTTVIEPISANGVSFIDEDSVSDPRLVRDSSDSYVYFYWNKSNSSGATEINALSERVHIATITLKVKPAVAQSQLHNTMLQALTFTDTDIGKEQQTTAGGDTEVLNNLLGAYWRQDGAAGALNFSKKPISSAFAEGGGFYQYAHTDTTGAEDPEEVDVKNYDIRIQFKLPNEVTKTSAQFWVREDKNSAGIKDAEIIIYDGEGNPVLENPLKTDANGREYAILDPGTYYYTITETSHWDYPNGQAVNPGFTKDCFVLKADGSVEMKKLTLDDSTETWTTQTSVNTITPFMLPKTRHQVFLDDKANNDSTGSASLAALDITISSSTIAYNSVPYYFTLQPGAGWKWTETDMSEVAKKLSAKLYAADPEGSNDTAKFRTKPGTLEPPTEGALIQWDAAKEQFYIDSTIGGDAIGIDPDPLRAGDLLILVDNPTELVEQTQYEITATVGSGGSMTFAQPTDLSALDTTNANESPSGSGTYVGLSILKETLAKGGTTSGTYTFTPRSGYSIDKVVINGAAQFLSAEAKAKNTAYTYKFENITGNQTIYVTFLDPNGNPASDASLTVTVGDHGGAVVAENPTGIVTPTPGTITGPDSETYTLPQSVENDSDPDNPKKLDKLELTITPEKGYEIDKVLVNGTPKAKTDLGISDPDAGTTAEGVTTGSTGTLSLAGDELKGLLDKGDVNSIVITFKPFGEESTQAIVTATVTDGMGAVSPAGVTIYSIGATPSYTMAAGSADWLLDTQAGSKAVMLYEDNVTPPDTTGTDASDQVTGTGPYSYTLPSLTGDRQLKITFSEKTYLVSGLIKTIHTNAGSSPEEIARATLTFKRQGDNKTFTAKSDNMAAAATNGTTLSFEVKVPKGTWDVTFSKQGYLNHTITGFEVKGTETEATNGITFGPKADDTGVYPVALIPGDAAGDGLAVAVNDASTVVAGWLTGATKRNRVKGDIDESEFKNSGSSGTADMGRVSSNLGKIRKSQTYESFCDTGSNTGMS